MTARFLFRRRLPVLLLLTACGGEGEAVVAEPPPPALPQDVLEPETARWAQVEQFRADLAATRHPSDGAGTARLALGPDETAVVRWGEPASFTIEFEAGELGVAEGGTVYFMPDPFWGWSPPQDASPEMPGYTRVTTAADGVLLSSTTGGVGGTGMFVVQIGGRALEAGETLRFEYGTARTDRYAERGARLWFGVDGDGDGYRRMLVDSPTVEVLPGPPERLALSLASVARVGESVRLTVAILDPMASSGVDFVGAVNLSGAPEGWDVPEKIELDAGHSGVRTIELTAASEGVVRIRGEVELGERTVETESNPLWVHPDAPRVYWADLHGHSNYSDGTGLPEDYFRYARDVAALDISALTDHDHFGVLFVDQHGWMWDEIKSQVAAFHDPGRFVTLLGFEWTSWIHGHRHVLYFVEDGEVVSSLDPETETPRQLWDHLRGKEALTFAHHSSGEPIATNWSFRPDPELEPVTEIASVHGSSEAADSPRRVRASRPGNYVRDVLDSGVRFGFIGSGDSHDGHPGFTHLSPFSGYRAPRSGVGPDRVGTGGVAAIRAEELTRASVLSAMRRRDVYATSGPRIVLDVRLERHAMGSAVAASVLPREASLHVAVVATAGLARLDLIRSGEPASLELDGERELFIDLPLTGLEAGEYVYVRVVQDDGALAWSSPIYVE